jgi:hypothetical protein
MSRAAPQGGGVTKCRTAKDGRRRWSVSFHIKWSYATMVFPRSLSLATGSQAGIVFGTFFNLLANMQLIHGWKKWAKWDAHFVSSNNGDAVITLHKRCTASANAYRKHGTTAAGVQNYRSVVAIPTNQVNPFDTEPPPPPIHPKIKKSVCLPLFGTNLWFQGIFVQIFL